MKGNTISVKPLNESAKIWLEKTLQLLKVQEYGKGSVRNYMQEMTLLFKHYNELLVEDLRQEHIERYLVFIKENHKVGRAKCRSVAQACSFFFKKVMPSDYIVPSNLYPKKQFKLPNIMTEKEIEQLFKAPLNLQERCVLGLLYGCGMRISEVFKTGQIERIATYINVSHEGVHLVDIDLLRNRGSPKKLQKSAI